MEETAYLQSTPANAAKLMESIEQDKAGVVAHAFQLQPVTSKIGDSIKTKTRKKYRDGESEVRSKYSKQAGKPEAIQHVGKSKSKNRAIKKRER
jgi:hypothetical protein